MNTYVVLVEDGHFDTDVAVFATERPLSRTPRPPPSTAPASRVTWSWTTR